MITFIHLHITDNKAEEVQAMFDMYYAGVKNTVNTTIDGGSPVEIVITSPTKLVTKKSDGGNLNTGTGITSEITQKTKMTGVDKIESIRNVNNKKRRKTPASKKTKPSRYNDQGGPPISWW